MAPPAVTMWLFPYLSYAAIAGMGGVLIAMAFTPGLQKDFYFSCITLVVAVSAYLHRPAPAAAARGAVRRHLAILFL